jgi:ribose-phosphate pyrophosphokinase
MTTGAHQLVLLSGSSHPDLANEIANYLNIKLGRVDLDTFPDGEISLQLLENVRGKDVFVVQSIAIRPNFHLMELLIMIDALRRASAKSIAAVIPYYGYCRQDRKDKARVPITAKLVANLLETAGVDRVLTMDLHANQVQGFFDIPVDNLYAMPSLVKAVRELRLTNFVVASPDSGSIKLAKEFAHFLGVEFIVVDKERLSSKDVVVTSVIGNAEGKDVLLVDDICSTAGTLVAAANACKHAGAQRIFAAASHPVMVGNALERIRNSPIEKIFVANTIPTKLENEERISVISVANIFGEAIRRVISAESISSLFTSPEERG